MTYLWGVSFLRPKKLGLHNDRIDVDKKDKRNQRQVTANSALRPLLQMMILKQLDLETVMINSVFEPPFALMVKMLLNNDKKLLISFSFDIVCLTQRSQVLLKLKNTNIRIRAV